MAQKLGQVAEGQLVKLNESGKPVEFYVAKQNYESGLNGAGRTLLVRKDVYQNGQWNASNVNTYANSTIDQWFNGTYKSFLDLWVQTKIGTTTFYYTPGGGSYAQTTLSRSVFTPSLYEYGFTNPESNQEGTPFPTASVLNKVLSWTRSCRTSIGTGNDAAWVLYLNTYLGYNSHYVNKNYGYRPCFTLPDTLYVWADGTVSQTTDAPSSITTPSVSMQGQSINVSWSSVDGADSYILQRKVDGGEWTQVYAGTLTTYTDTAGSWTTVQYQVCGVFDGTNGAFAQSDPISIIPASALVISGSDGDLGTVTNDIPYNVASDTGNQISLTRTVNGALVASLTVNSGFSYNIPVMDLPTGTGTIVITATVTASSGQVTATRTWTYTKAAQTFPGFGGVAQLTQNGQNVFPMTLAESVKAIGGPWGGNLSTALNKLAMAATYSATAVPKYTEVNVNLSTAQSGDIVNLPVNGVMAPHIVVQVGNPDASMYDSSCEGVWLLRKDIVENGQWNSTNVNTLAGSTIMTIMQGYVTDYDSAVQAAIQTVKIPYCVGNGSATVNTLGNGLECKMFPLGAYEVGFTSDLNSSIIKDGTLLQYFDITPPSNATDQKKIAYLNDVVNSWYTRTAESGITDYCCGVSNMGNFQNTVVYSATCGYRPCFLLPATFTATYYVDTEGTVHAEQEYTTDGDFYDLWGNIIPTVKIATGSYVGTGTKGESNPNILTFPGKPIVVMVMRQDYTDVCLMAPMIYGCSETTISSSNTTRNTLYLIWGDDFVKYWSPYVDEQHNVEGKTYIYFAIYQ